MTDWQSSLRGYFSGLLSFLFPAHFLKGPRRITLARWDALNQSRKTVGIGELDNHATIKKIMGIPFVAFPFDRAFRFIRTHVLTEDKFSGDSGRDMDMLYQALLYGRCYFALEYFRKTRNFQYWIQQGEKNFRWEIVSGFPVMRNYRCPALKKPTSGSFETAGNRCRLFPIVYPYRLRKPVSIAWKFL